MHREVKDEKCFKINIAFNLWKLMPVSALPGTPADPWKHLCLHAEHVCVCVTRKGQS